jgi:hypothetical protein
MDWLSQGLFGPAPDPNAPPSYTPEITQMAQAYGADPALVQRLIDQKRTATLGQVGAQLLAAAQAGPIGQRGQMISKLGDAASAGPDLTSSLMNAAQMKLYTESLKDKQSERERKAAVRKQIEGLGLTGTEAAYAAADPDGYFRSRYARETAERDPIRQAQLADLNDKRKTKEQERAWFEMWIQGKSPEEQALYRANPQLATKDAYEERDRTLKVRQLVDSGLDPALAKGIAAGRYVVSKDPITGVPAVVDIATGQPVSGAPGAPAAQPVPVGPPAGGAGDFGDATGPSGAIKSTVNTIVGAVGGSIPNKATEDRINALNRLNLTTRTVLATEIQGRPSNYLLQALDKVTIQPGSFLEGDDRSLSKLTETQRLIDIRINQVAPIANGIAGPQEARKAIQHLQELRQLRAEYDTVISQFSKSPQAPAAATGGAPPAASGPPPARTLSVRPVGQ